MAITHHRGHREALEESVSLHPIQASTQLGSEVVWCGRWEFGGQSCGALEEHDGSRWGSLCPPEVPEVSSRLSQVKGCLSLTKLARHCHCVGSAWLAEERRLCCWRVSRGAALARWASAGLARSAKKLDIDGYEIGSSASVPQEVPHGFRKACAHRTDHWSLSDRMRRSGCHRARC